MRTQIIMLSLSAALTASGCNPTECADGTIERDGKCEPANVMVGSAKCGPFTTLVGDQCVPQFPPTECDPGSTKADTDPTTGVTTCIGTGTVSCNSPLACPTPTGATKQTICGQLYDFRDGSKLVGANTGAQCDPASPATSGPCALQIVAYDAVDFADGGAAPSPLPVADTYIDDCGRYRLTDIDTNSVSLYIGLGIDDAGGPIGNPAGTTVTTAVAAPKQPMTATKGLDAYIVSGALATGWGAGGVNLGTTGVYAPIFYAHKLGSTDRTLQTGVTFTRLGNPVPNNDFYFGATATDRVTLDGAATTTGANGTVLVNSATVMDSIAYSGSGGLSTTSCRWETRAGAALPGIVFIQSFHKIDVVGQTCNE